MIVPTLRRRFAAENWAMRDDGPPWGLRPQARRLCCIFPPPEIDAEAAEREQ
jgi:hypothetical protein